MDVEHVSARGLSGSRSLALVVVGGEPAVGGDPLELVARAHEELSVLCVGLQSPRPVGVTGGLVDSVGQIIADRIDVVGIVDVELKGGADLLDVRQVLGLLGRVLSLGEDREKNGGEDRNDRDDHQKFDEGECLFHGWGPIVPCGQTHRTSNQHKAAIR